MKYIITPNAQVVTEEAYHNGMCPEDAVPLARRIFGKIQPDKLKLFSERLKDDLTNHSK